MAEGVRRDWGAGSLRPRNGGIEARYSFTDDAAKRHTRSKLFVAKDVATAEKDAGRWLRERVAEIAAGKTADPGAVTVREFLMDWLSSLGMAQLEPTTRAWYRSAVNRHIIPSLGGVKLAKLSATKIDAFLASKLTAGRLDGKPGGLGPASMRRLAITLHASLDAAVRAGLLVSNPADNATRPSMPKRDVTLDVWHPAEITRFIDATRGDRLSAVWRLAAMSGLRRSELAGLHWPDINLDSRVLSVRRAVVVTDGKDSDRVYVKGPKTSRSRRTVDLDESTVAELRGWKKIQTEDRLKAGPAWSAGEWVITDEIGRPLSPDWLTNRFEVLAKSAGLRRIPIRMLRHSHATALLAAGVNPKIVSERLGHSSVVVTLDIYSAVLPSMQRDAIDKLAALIGN